LVRTLSALRSDPRLASSPWATRFRPLRGLATAPPTAGENYVRAASIHESMRQSRIEL